MGKEIEKKFLVENEQWKEVVSSKSLISQGYLNSHIDRTVRIRIEDDIGKITVKGRTIGATRLEFEYEIPLSEAREMLDLCEKPIIQKNRYRVKHYELIWEIDEFLGENEGLIVAEIELHSEHQEISKPKWLGKEVTEDPKYYNSSLILQPYKTWFR